MIFTFLIFLVLFASIGIYSSKQKKASSADYLLANKSIKPWLVALSAVATNNSGYMFIGMIGFTYSYGLSSFWLMFGWIFGDFLGSLFIYKNIRIITGKHNVMSFGTLLGGRAFGVIKSIRLLVGLMSVIFLSTYAAAQFIAGGKALFVILDWPLWLGIIIGATLVVLYCYSGGIRASIWTDAAQSIVMIIAMGILFYAAVSNAGGISEANTRLHAVSQGYMKWFPEKNNFGYGGAFLFVIGWVCAGFGVVGQPHIMVRYMTLDSPKNINQVRIYYYLWFAAFYAITIGVGLLGRITLPSVGEFDPELSLPMLSQILLPDYMVGIMLAGIFAATISTADSLVISCTASFTNDLFPRLKHNYLANKLITLFLTALAILFALLGEDNVFQLVIYSWAILGTAFAPLLTFLMLGKHPGELRSVLTIFSGGIVTFVWDKLGWNEYVYEMLPGMVVGFAVYFLLAFLDAKTEKLS